MRFYVLAGLIASRLAASHPGEDHTAELLVRREFLQSHLTNLDHCATDLEAFGLTERSIHRRRQTARFLRENRGLMDNRDKYALDTTYVSDTDSAHLFKSNVSCVLAPEEIVGPYYVVGESIRSNIVENQKGIPLELDVQFIDATTCQPVIGKYVDLWQANATGVYGGVVNPENGNGSADPSNGSKTFLRGIQKTDNDGVVKFSTIFPGHYTGRASHIHVMLHPNAQPYPNGTIIDTTAAYVGQMYLNQSLISSVERRPPYTRNLNSLTPNSEDHFLQQDLRQGGNPVLQHQLLGSRLEDGILAWLSYGVNPARRSHVTPGATHSGTQPQDTYL